MKLIDNNFVIMIDNLKHQMQIRAKMDNKPLILQYEERPDLTNIQSHLNLLNNLLEQNKSYIWTQGKKSSLPI